MANNRVRLLVLCLPLLISFISTVPSSAASSKQPTASLPDKWHRLGLGRTVHLFTTNISSSRLLILTSLGAVASIDLHTSQIRWRITPPPAPPPPVLSHPHPLSVATGFVTGTTRHEPSVLCILMSDHTLRAVDPVKQSIIWQVPACQLGHIQRPGIIPITTCDGMVHSISASTGNVLVSTDNDEKYPEFNAVTELSGHDAKQLTWDLKREGSPDREYRLISEIDGALRLINNSPTEQNELWHREDGIAHVIAGSIFFSDHLDEHRDTNQQQHQHQQLRNDVNFMSMAGIAPVVVVLSQLGTLFALTDASTVRWKVSVDGRCNLLDGDRSDLVVVICTNENEIQTEVKVIRIRDGHIVFSKVKKEFHAVRASVECCCSINNDIDDDICIVGIDSEGHEHWFSSCDDADFNSESSDRGWLLYSIGGKEIHGIRNGKSSWKVSMPNSATITTVTSKHMSSLSSSSNVLRPAPVRVTATRDLLHKYVDEDVIHILAYDNNSSEMYTMIIDGRTGSLHDVRVHEMVANIPSACAVSGDHWFIYSFWNVAMLQQEIHIIDMYHDGEDYNGHGGGGKGDNKLGVHSWVGETVRAAVRALFGREIMSALGIPDPDFTIPCLKDSGIVDVDVDVNININDSTTTTGTKSSTTSTSATTTSKSSSRCSSPYQQRWQRQQHYNRQQHHYYPQQQARHHRVTRRKPVFIRSSMLTTQRITSLSVTQTLKGITEPAVIATLESGQVTLIPKFLLDALRPPQPSNKQQVNAFRKLPIMLLPRYEPILHIESSAKKSTYFAHGFHMPGGVKKIAVSPSYIRESCTLMAVFGMDIVFDSVQPLGSFDTLPKHEFAYSAVVGMIVVLVGGVLYTNRLKARISMNKAWK